MDSLCVEPSVGSSKLIIGAVQSTLNWQLFSIPTSPPYQADLFPALSTDLICTPYLPSIGIVQKELLK